MHARVRRSLVCVAVAAAATSRRAAARSADRQGRSTPQAQPVPDADVRVEAMFGFAGGDFLGQRTFAARTNAKGEWALLAFKAGIWVFDAAAPGRLPDASPCRSISSRPPVPESIGSRRSGIPFCACRLRPRETSARSSLTPPRRPERSVPIASTPLLARLADSNDPVVLTAAGTICLMMRDATVARPFFRRALDRDPTSFRAALGMGSSALMQRNVDAAAKAFAEARNLTKDKDERGFLSAAILELNKAHYVMKGTY